MLETDAVTAIATLEHENGRLATQQAVARDVCNPPDVLLDAAAKVEEIKLDVQGLRAHVSLLAQVADLLQLSVGADVQLDRVTLLIKDVEADAHLEVRLDEVRAILKDAFGVIREHPEILGGIPNSVFDPRRNIADKAVGETVGEIGGALEEATGEEGGATEPTNGVDEEAGQLEPVEAEGDAATEPEVPQTDEATPDTSESEDVRAGWRARLLSRRMTTMGPSRHINGLCGG